MDAFGADVVGPIDIAVEARSTADAAEPPPPWRVFVDVAVVATGLRRIRLVDPVHGEFLLSGFLAEVAEELPVGPLTDLLVGDLTQAHTSLDVAHIAHHDLTDPFRHAEAHREP